LSSADIFFEQGEGGVFQMRVSARTVEVS